MRASVIHVAASEWPFQMQWSMWVNHFLLDAWNDRKILLCVRACVCLCENIADAYVTGGNSRLFGSTIIALLKVLPVRMTVHPSGELKLSMLARNTTVHIMRWKIG